MLENKIKPVGFKKYPVHCTLASCQAEQRAVSLDICVDHRLAANLTEGGEECASLSVILL